MVLVSDAGLRSLPEDPASFWPAFHRAFPNTTGLTSVSGIGLGEDGRQALLVLSHTCGSLCGAGHVVLLNRGANGRWHVAYARMLWIS